MGQLVPRLSDSGSAGCGALETRLESRSLARSDLAFGSTQRCAVSRRRAPIDAEIWPRPRGSRPPTK
eukprot:883333-Heterocapsa_arctica.AAC.1